MTKTVVLNDKEFVVQTVEKINSIVHAGVPGPKGPQGDPGESNIGGYPFELLSLNNNDVLAFSANKWVNKAQEELVDGGNF